jgi:hypothetical protein
MVQGDTDPSYSERCIAERWDNLANSNSSLSGSPGDPGFTPDLRGQALQPVAVQPNSAVPDVKRQGCQLRGPTLSKDGSGKVCVRIDNMFAHEVPRLRLQLKPCGVTGVSLIAPQGRHCEKDSVGCPCILSFSATDTLRDDILGFSGQAVVAELQQMMKTGKKRVEDESSVKLNRCGEPLQRLERSSACSYDGVEVRSTLLTPRW